MSEKELADYLERRNFLEEMRLYLERLQNGRDYSPWKALRILNEATVKVSLATNNRITITAYEGKEAQLREELADAKETIKKQAKEIASLKKEAKDTIDEKIAAMPRDTIFEEEESEEQYKPDLEGETPLVSQRERKPKRRRKQT